MPTVQPCTLQELFDAIEGGLTPSAELPKFSEYPPGNMHGIASYDDENLLTIDENGQADIVPREIEWHVTLNNLPCHEPGKASQTLQDAQKLMETLQRLLGWSQLKIIMVETLDGETYQREIAAAKVKKSAAVQAKMTSSGPVISADAQQEEWENVLQRSGTAVWVQEISGYGSYNNIYKVQKDGEDKIYLVAIDYQW